MARQIKIDCPRLPVPFTYVYMQVTQYTIADCGGSPVGPRQTDERDWGGAKTHLCWGEQAGEKTLDCTVDSS